MNWLRGRRKASRREKNHRWLLIRVYGTQWMIVPLTEVEENGEETGLGKHQTLLETWLV